ncbi:MAG: universal stress protein [Geopsychrobacter sp.]|nr:universal stress protein [Geopsychrobacter sp.]
MPIKEILVHLDNSDRCQTRLEVAISLGLKHQAHLTGLYATPPPYYAVNWVDPPPAVVAMEARFSEMTSAAGLAADLICTDAPGLIASVNERVILQAYYADLVIVGQTDPSAGSLRNPDDLPEQLALSAGRPVLVIPRFGEFKTVGQRILLAWRGGRASSRALNDAIPFLEQAKQVTLSMVNPDEQFETQAKKLCTYLARHGTKAAIDKLSAENIRVGDVLLNQTCDLGIDLVVLGVFAQRRLGKTRLGPVGKHFLEYMTIPVLMSR